MSLLTDKQAKFVAAYLANGGNGTAAAVAAGYAKGSAHVAASRLLRDVKVAAAIEGSRAKVQTKAEVKAERVLTELLRIATADVSLAFNEDGTLKPLHEIPEDVRRAISGVEVEELYAGFGEEKENVGRTSKLKFWDKNRALHTLCENLGLLKLQVEHSGVGGAAGPTVVELVDPFAEPAKAGKGAGRG